MSATPWLKLLRNIRPLVLVSTLLSVISSAQTQPPLFPTTSFVDIGAQVVTATGDFNGDGQPDLVTIPALSGPVIVSVLLNAANPTPPLIVTTNLGPSINSLNHLVAVDMNNDKKLDLVANAFNGTSSGIAVLFGNGDGTFQSPVFYPVVGSGYGVATDLNGDSYPDLVIVTAPLLTSLKVAVLLNQGSNAPGTLSAPTFYPLSITFPQSGPINIDAADFNGDGKQDILVGGTSLAVFYGAGDGTLQSQQSPPVPIGLTGGGYFVASDLNHDGISDVAYIATSTSTATQLSLQVLLGHSNGTFTVGSNLPLNLSIAFPIALVPAGTTNNGTNVNLAAVSDKTSILLGDGNGSFSQGPSYAINGPPFPILNSSGKTDLVFELNNNLTNTVDNKITRLTGNGDGTFQGIPTLPLSSTFPFPFAAADLNGDGLTDVLYVDSQNNLVTGLGRGNGTFTVTNSVAGAPGKLLVAADFNADGNSDAAIITPGDGSHYPFSPVVDSMLVLYKGNGDGSFQSSSAPVDLQVVGATSAITGDFNGDGTTDVVVAYSNAYLDPATSQGLVFLPGKGDGTFAAAAPLPPQSFSTSTPLLLAADLNNDHKLDLLWNGSIYLGHGDGTFQQSTVPLPGPVLAVGDLNGDSIPDVVIGPSVYAGNGDGTFHSSPVYTATLPSYTKLTLATIADSNADGNPDILLQYQPTDLAGNTYPGGNTFLAVFLGDSKGNFTADSNSYYAGNSNNILPGLPGFPPVASMAVLARLNNQAPQLSKDIALDYLTWTNDGATALLNQTNPVPGAAQPVPSRTQLAVSATSVVVNQDLTLTVTVTGIAPTGNVTFRSPGGEGVAALVFEVPITNGIASITTGRPAGTYSFTASYSGDTNNNASTSNTVTVTVTPAPTTTALSTSSSSVNQGQLITYTATVTARYNPTGTVTFTSGTTTLGKSSVVFNGGVFTNGVATLPVFATTAGTYNVTASYSGDDNNRPSTSNAVAITVVAPDYTVSASPASAIITAGQSATTTLTVTPVGGYNGTIKFSCGTLPTGATCAFAPATVTPAGNAPATTTLTITTTATTTASLHNKISRGLQGIAWAGLVFLAFSPRRLRGLNSRLMRASLLTFLFAAGLLSLSGCSSTSPKAPVTIPGTPAGVQAISVTVADSGITSHAINFQLTIQ